MTIRCECTAKRRKAVTITETDDGGEVVAEMVTCDRCHLTITPWRIVGPDADLYAGFHDDEIATTLAEQERARQNVPTAFVWSIPPHPRLERIGDDEAKPLATLDSLYGSVPNLTAGLDSVAYVRQQRDKEEDDQC